MNDGSDSTCEQVLEKARQEKERLKSTCVVCGSKFNCLTDDRPTEDVVDKVTSGEVNLPVIKVSFALIGAESAKHELGICFKCVRLFVQARMSGKQTDMRSSSEVCLARLVEFMGKDMLAPVETGPMETA